MDSRSARLTETVSSVSDQRISQGRKWIGSFRTVTQTAAQVKEYMQIFDRAPVLKAAGLEDTYKVLADFGDAVLAGQLGKRALGS